MKKLVVATDLSPRSDRAMRRALRIAARLGAQAHVISVVDDAMPADMVAQLAESVTERLTTHVASMNAPEGTVVATLTGDTVEQVSEYCIAQEADLLVMGLHRRRSLFDRMRETTSERIVAASLVPVLIVKDPADHDYTNVLAPISFSEACAAALRAAGRLAPEATLTAYHALHVPFAGLTGGSENSEMARAVQAESEETRTVWMEKNRLPEGLQTPEIITGGVAQILRQKLASTEPDLLACGTHTRSSLATHRLGSFTADLMRDPPVDLLIAPPVGR